MPGSAVMDWPSMVKVIVSLIIHPFILPPSHCTAPTQWVQVSLILQQLFLAPDQNRGDIVTTAASISQID